MKPVLLLIVFVAISHQQNHRRLRFDFSWISLVGKPLNYPLKTFREYIGRMGWSQQRNRLLFVNIASNKKSQPTQTVTLTMTSTCTSLTVFTCIPRANFLPRAPAQIINCRRKRSDPESLPTIIPTQILKVMPTERPNPKSEKLGSHEIYSSKEEDFNSLKSSGLDPEILETQQLLKRKDRGFFHLWPSYSSTETTVTNWSVVSSVFTSTFIPAADFLCVPPGYQICVP